MNPRPSSFANARRLPVILTAAVLVFQAWRLTRFLWDNAVSLLYRDQWDFYNPLFQHASWWQTFVYQHGPHREGIGLILDRIVLEATSWNARSEALLMAGSLVLAAIGFLVLKKKLFGEISYSDVIIPCLVMTYTQMEALTLAPNPSYSAVPELLIALYCLAWLLSEPALSYTGVLLTNFLLIYTGFGIFMGPMTVALFGIEIFRAHRNGRALAPAIAAVFVAALSLASFFHAYRWDPAVSCFVFPDPHPWKYIWFMTLAFSYFLNVLDPRSVTAATLAGEVLLFSAIAVLFVHGRRLLLQRDAPGGNGGAANIDRIIVAFTGFSLLFLCDAAVGRVCLGMPWAAQASRYMGLLIPAFLALYFHLLTVRSRLKRTILIWALAILLIPSTFKAPERYLSRINTFKRAWKECIVQRDDIDGCDRDTKFMPYPDPPATHMREKLDFLKRNRLNLYSGQ